MSPAETAGAIRRVTAVLSGGSHGSDVLHAAADIAARLHAEVQALVVEDANLPRLARLEVARMVSLFEAAGPLVPADLAATFERLVAEARAALELAAGTLGLAWSVQVLRGDPTTDLAQVVEANELLVADLGQGLWTSDPRFGPALWEITERRAASLLLIERRLRRPTPAVLIAERSPLAERALQLAADLIAEHGRRLDVLVAGPDDRGDGMAAWVREQLRAAGRRAHFTPLRDCAVDTVMLAARQVHAGILVLPADSPCLTVPSQIEALVAKADCALLLLR